MMIPKSKILKLILLLTVLLAVYCLYNETTDIILERNVFTFKNLPPGFDGYKMVVLSDLHYGCTPTSVIKRAVELANNQTPDVILLLGDYVCQSEKELQPCMEIIKGLHSKGGVYTVLGNHDDWIGEEISTKALQKIGVTVLSNKYKRISIGEDSLYLIGIKDYGINIKKTFAALKTSNEFNILLSHRPDAALEINGLGIDLMLSGHTHGGQIKFPFYKKFIKGTFVESDFISGKYAVNDTILYITRGIGEVFIPVRYLSRPEVTQIILRRK